MSKKAIEKSAASDLLPGQNIDGDEAAAVTRMDTGVMGGLTKGSFDAPSDLIADGFTCEINYTMEEGDQVRGVFLGEGAPTTMESLTEKGKMVDLKRWRIALPGGGNINLLGSAGLDNRMAILKPGQHCIVQHHGKVTTRAKFSVNNYVVWPGNMDAGTVAKLSDQAKVARQLATGSESFPATNGQHAA